MSWILNIRQNILFTERGKTYSNPVEIFTKSIACASQRLFFSVRLKFGITKRCKLKLHNLLCCLRIWYQTLFEATTIAFSGIMKNNIFTSTEIGIHIRSRHLISSRNFSRLQQPPLVQNLPHTNPIHSHTASTHKFKLTLSSSHKHPAVYFLELLLCFVEQATWTARRTDDQTWSPGMYSLCALCENST